MLNHKQRRAILPYWFIAPAVLVLIGVLVYPWVWTVGLSFQSWNVFRGTQATYVGIDNYANLLADPLFLGALRNSLTLVVGAVSIQVILGMGIALLLTRITIGRNVLLTCMFLPMLITEPVVGLMWKVLLHHEWGLINFYIRQLGGSAVGWLTDPSVVLTTVLGIEVWQHTGFATLILFAGLQTVPEELYEAAAIDGARAPAIFWHIILPWLRPLLLIIVLFRALFTIRTFGAVYVLFPSGGPSDNAQVLGTYLFENLRVTWQLGEGSATAVAILAITVVIGLPLLINMYREVREL